MPVGGEINQHIQGNRANVDRQFSTLKLTGNIDSSSKTTGCLQVLGGIGVTGNIFSNGLTVANSTEALLYLNTTAVSGTAAQIWQINGTNQLAMGYTTGAGIAISDLANGGSWLYQSSAIAGYVRSVNNIIDDGGGGVSLATANANAVNIGTGTYTGQITIGNTSNNLSPLIQGGTSSNAALTINSTSTNGSYLYVNISSTNKVAFGSGVGKSIDIYDFGSGNSWLFNNGTHGYVGSANNILDNGTTGAATFNGTVTVNSSSTSPLVLQSSTAGGCSIAFLTSSGSINVGNFGYSSINGLNLQNGSGSFVLSQGGGTISEKSLHSNNNILDDGTGNMTIIGTSDPILRLRRSSYSANFISRIRLVDDNTSGSYWEIGTDVNGNKGGDFFIYGQGTSALGICFNILGTGVVQTNTMLTNRSGTSYSTTTTISASDVIKGIVVVPAGTGAITLTMPTPASIYTALGLTSSGLKPSFSFKLITLSTNNATLSAGTGWTVFTSNQTGNHSTLNFEIELTSSTTATLYGG